MGWHRRIRAVRLVHVRLQYTAPALPPLPSAYHEWASTECNVCQMLLRPRIPTARPGGPVRWVLAISSEWPTGREGVDALPGRPVLWDGSVGCRGVYKRFFCVHVLFLTLSRSVRLHVDLAPKRQSVISGRGPSKHAFPRTSHTGGAARWSGGWYCVIVSVPSDKGFTILELCVRFTPNERGN